MAMVSGEAAGSGIYEGNALRLTGALVAVYHVHSDQTIIRAVLEPPSEVTARQLSNASPTSFIAEAPDYANMASSNMNLNRGRRRNSSGPQLQAPPSRRSSSLRGAISRLAATTSATRPPIQPVGTDGLSTSTPGESAPILPMPRSQKAKSYGALNAPRISRRTSDGGAGYIEGTGKIAAARTRVSHTTELPTSTTHRLPTRSFLLPPGASTGAARAKPPPLPKHQRTSKTSQKLVVLPSAPQTKPLAKQLVLLDEEQETSDDATHPRGNLPPRRSVTFQEPPGIERSYDQEGEDEEVKEGRVGEPSKSRVRDYKSVAERMSKEERKKAGYRRITAYFIAEGLKMKPLAGFLKREHNVLPRVFDEALYAMYHLPLLPGYGPQTNVRSSAPPAPTQPVSGDGGKSILTRLEEAEENGYQGSYFPPPQNLINLEDGPTGAHDGFTTEDGDRPADPSSNLPGVVQPAAVDEVREYDGYVTSSSLHRETEGVLSRSDPEPFTYEYNPYPSSSLSSHGSTLRKHLQADFSASDLDHSDTEHATTATTLLTSHTNSSEDTERDLHAERHIIDSGVETDDPGIETDPGVYRSWSPGPRKSPTAANEDEEISASIMTTVPLRGSRISDSGDQDVRGMGLSGIDDENKDFTGTSRPSMVRAAMLPNVEGFGADVDSLGVSNQLIQDELHSAAEGPSAYERQLAYERQRQQDAENHEVMLELERERLRQLEYEQALEREQDRERERQLDNVGEVVFFEYGVLVFFGLTERQERDILEDIDQAGVMRRPISEDDFEIEECHFAHDPKISYPRIYNDFFTLKSRSHLLKLSIAHALAQSTLLARYETLAQQTLSSPLTLSIPRQLASSGSLQLRRHEALKLTGRLFKLRRDVNLVSNVLDVPELFWSEASLKDLYDAVRDYMEIGPRVENLNEKLGVASDFLDAIHDHLNNNAMERITWIIIWLIVVAVLVELGEIIARLVVHSTLESERSAARAIINAIPAAAKTTPLSKDEALRILEGIMTMKTSSS